jgi:hypothetical protein
MIIAVYYLLSRRRHAYLFVQSHHSNNLINATGSDGCFSAEPELYGLHRSLVQHMMYTIFNNENTVTTQCWRQRSQSRRQTAAGQLAIKILNKYYEQGTFSIVTIFELSILQE